MINNDLKVHVAVTSHARPYNVPLIEAVLGCRATFYVIEGEGDAYRSAGAQEVIECRPGISQARNTALRRAAFWRLPSIQVSDDLKKLERIELIDGKRVLTPITFAVVVKTMVKELTTQNYEYAGIAVNSNPLNYTGVDISYDKLIVCDLNCFMPGSLLFDPALPQKEDYDYTIRQLIKYGGVVRLNNILGAFPHRDNAGGANTYRNVESEAAATELLAAKWPGLLKPHPTRPGQVSLNYKAIQARRNGQSQLF